MCIRNAELYYAVQQIQAKSGSVIRFLIPLTNCFSEAVYLQCVSGFRNAGERESDEIVPSFWMENRKARKMTHRQQVTEKRWQVKTIYDD